MNPCPCGFHGSPRGECRCSDQQIQRYLGRLSGPLLDRIDMHVEVPGLPAGALLAGEAEEDSATVRARVMAVHARQQARSGLSSHDMPTSRLMEWCPMEAGANALLTRLADRFGLSARVCHRMIRVARTIADLAGQDSLTEAHLGEAFAYRCLQRLLPGKID